MDSYMALWMFLAVFVVLLSGYPVAFVLSGTALMFAALGLQLDAFDADFLMALPNRLFGIMNNETLIAVPLFVFMGVMLERAKIAESLLEAMSELFASVPGGLGIAVTIVGMLMAASTGIVGATVVTMGLLSLPTMLKRNYDPAISCGIICASGTLGQIIPPSIVLVLLGDVISSAYQQAQLEMGVFAPETISVGDLFAGAILPGLLLVILYLIYISVTAWLSPDKMPKPDITERQQTGFYWRVAKSLLPPLMLMLAVLGSIIGGLATPTEAASVGAVGALLLAIISKQLSKDTLQEVMRDTTRITSMVFMILIGAALFSLVFRGFEGDELIIELLSELPGGKVGAMFSVMLVMFLLGFVLDFIEITFVIVPIVGPVLLTMGVDPVWLGIMIALNLQTSFLTPPFGFALFYLRGVAPDEVTTGQIYKGVMPFIIIQLLLLGVLAYFPEIATWLPSYIYA
ncbi:MAG TPA: TRAP transporter large permease subunit [Methyloprofundus sp.]|uniref:TRAP transporter large permease n=1 Tax=Methyloprofundus sp. TaxID=2020875 RepID=UPI0017B5AAEA|nr:TRAP transporter large permease subunit [Methyloprofundus sp.]HIG64903.1 TRAP transporter large permease subunit [Methyloprofundus sp.]HIL79524.1 TRAP transporter large permease subunit [Methylococcales bacterium]